MKPIPEYQELVISLFAPEIISTLLTEKFLFQSHIIPKKWKLAQPPQISNEQAQVVFTNDIIISATIGMVTFSEYLDTNPTKEPQIIAVARKWVKTLSKKFCFEGIKINPSSFFSFNTQKTNKNTIDHYIPHTLLTNGNWKEVSEQPLKASLNLAYIVKGKEFNLKIEDVLLRSQDNSLQTGVLFSGIFYEQIVGNSLSDKGKKLLNSIEQWQEYLNTYQQIVNDKFLNLKQE